MAAATAIIGGVAGLVGQGAGLIGGIGRGRKERAGQRAELVENIFTARENIASLREQKGLLTSQTGQLIGEMKRGEKQEIGAQRGAYAGSGVRIGAGGSAEAVRAETRQIRGAERAAVKEAAGVQQSQLEREIQRTGRQEEQMESALRSLAGKRKRGGKKRRHEQQLAGMDFEYTEGF